MALTQETILTFLLENGGKVKNSELLNNFKPQINCSDPAEKKHNRDLFKRFVNSVAVVKQVEDVKFVVVKKRYQDFVKGEMNLNAQKSDLDDSFSSQNTSFSPNCSERSAPARYGSVKMLSDIENNNRPTCCSSYIHGNSLNDNANRMPVHISDAEGCPRDGAIRSGKPINDEPHTVGLVKVLNVSSDKTKTGAVFAIVAVRPTSQSPRDLVPVRQEQLNNVPKVPGLKTPLKSSALTRRALPPPERGRFPNDPGVSTEDVWTSPWKHKQQDIKSPGSPQFRRPPPKISKPGEDGKYSESVPLEPLAHEWLVKSAAGLWGQIYALLLQDTQLVEKRDFMSGFTALHWAAKGGNSEMVRNILDISKKSGVRVDVDSRTHGGYTPLHLAAMHGRDAVVALLVQDYGADANIRDNAGKKPHHYLGEGVPAELRDMLGGPRASQQVRCEDRPEQEDCRELPRGLNTLGRLFQPHLGHRKKHRQQRPSASTTEEDD